MSDTPRTDAIGNVARTDEFARRMTDLARQLERELAETQRQLQKVTDSWRDDVAERERPAAGTSPDVTVAAWDVIHEWRSDGLHLGEAIEDLVRALEGGATPAAADGSEARNVELLLSRFEKFNLPPQIVSYLRSQAESIDEMTTRNTTHD